MFLGIVLLYGDSTHLWLPDGEPNSIHPRMQLAHFGSEIVVVFRIAGKLREHKLWDLKTQITGTKIYAISTPEGGREGVEIPS